MTLAAPAALADKVAMTGDARGWWDGRVAAAALALAAAVPLLWPAVPPLADLPGHIGRYRILLEAGRGPLAAHWTVDWAPVGNLGVDAAVLALAPLLGLEPAAKLAVLAIPVLTVAALLWLARAAHGRVPGTALWALPLAYAAPFQLGFVNFALAQAGMFAALALWLRLARGGVAAWRRAALFVPVAALLWLAHAFGWALFGLFAFGAEWALRRARGERHAPLRAAATCAPLALPVAALLLAGGAAPAGGTGVWLNLPLKAFWLAGVLYERWRWWDVAGAAAIAGVLAFAWRSPRLGFAPVLALPAALGAAAFAALPAFHAGGSYVDARVLPATLALALLAIRPADRRTERRLAAAGAGFFAARLAGTAAAFALYAQGWAPLERAIDRLPVGAAVLVLVNEPAADAWTNPRLAHVAGLAVARRRVFVNEQWALPGQQPIAPRHPAAAPFDRDPSQLIYPPTVPGALPLAAALDGFDRGTFGYVWTIGFPRAATDRPGLVPVRADRASTLYRVARGPRLPPPAASAMVGAEATGRR